MNKASLESLNALHDAVAKQLSNNLDDPKVLAQAITFLRNNNITVDIVESNPLQSLSDNIKSIANNLEPKTNFSVEDMLAVADS